MPSDAGCIEPYKTGIVWLFGPSTGQYVTQQCTLETTKWHMLWYSLEVYTRLLGITFGQDGGYKKQMCR
jgi:hypothetical protein